MVAPEAEAYAAAEAAGAAVRRRLVRRAAGGRTIPLDELEPRDIAAWRDLAARAVEPNPFLEPECVLPAARHVRGSHVALLVVEAADGDWLACMPVSSRLPLRDREVPVLATWRYLYAPLATPLVDGSVVAPATERLVEQALRSSRLGVVAFPWIGDDGPVATAMVAALEAKGRAPVFHRVFERAVMRRPTLAEGVEALLGRGHRRDLERLGRRLAEKLEGALELRDASDSPAALDGFFAVEAAGWKGTNGTALASQPEHEAFFRELCEGFRTVGRLQLLTLGTDTRTVSYKCNLLAGDAVFCFKIAFDESFAHYRPGLQLELRMLRLFRDRMSQAWMDSCAAPNSPLFRHLWREQRPIGSYVIAAGRARAWAIRRSVSALGPRLGS